MSKPFTLDWDLYDHLISFLEKTLGSSGWQNLEFGRMRHSPDDDTIVGLTVNGLKSFPGDEDPKVELRLSLVATKDGDSLVLQGFEMHRKGTVFGYLLPQEFLKHYGKEPHPRLKFPVILKTPPQPEYWVVNKGVNLQALLESYDKLARLMGYPTMFTTR